jgi:hypothetical protein
MMTDPYTTRTESYSTESPRSTESPLGPSGSTTDTVKSEGRRVADDAAQGGKHVANVAANEASNVAQEAKDQARSLLGEAGSQLSTQASQQKDSLVSWLRTLADELRSMADSARQGSDGAEGQSAQSGVATTLAERGADYAHRTASWLGDREPRAVFDEVGGFARRRPGTFLLIAAAGGVLVGRLTRGLTAGHDDDAYTGGHTGNGYAADRYTGNRYADTAVVSQEATGEPLSGDGDSWAAGPAAGEWPVTTPAEGDAGSSEATRYPEAGR